MLAWVRGQVRAIARVAQYDEAARVTGQGKAVARSITDSGLHADALAEVAEVLAEAGDSRSACRVGRSCLRSRAVDNLRDTNTATGPVRLRGSRTRAG